MQVLSVKDIERTQGGVENLNLLKIDRTHVPGGGYRRLGGRAFRACGADQRERYA